MLCSEMKDIYGYITRKRGFEERRIDVDGRD